MKIRLLECLFDSGEATVAQPTANHAYRYSDAIAHGNLPAGGLRSSNGRKRFLPSCLTAAQVAGAPRVGHHLFKVRSSIVVLHPNFM